MKQFMYWKDVEYWLEEEALRLVRVQPASAQPTPPMTTAEDQLRHWNDLQHRATDAILSWLDRETWPPLWPAVQAIVVSRLTLAAHIASALVGSPDTPLEVAQWQEASQNVPDPKEWAGWILVDLWHRELPLGLQPDPAVALATIVGRLAGCGAFANTPTLSSETGPDANAFPM